MLRFLRDFLDVGGFNMRCAAIFSDGQKHISAEHPTDILRDNGNWVAFFAPVWLERRIAADCAYNISKDENRKP